MTHQALMPTIYIGEQDSTVAEPWRLGFILLPWKFYRGVLNPTPPWSVTTRPSSFPKIQLRILGFLYLCVFFSHAQVYTLILSTFVYLSYDTADEPHQLGIKPRNMVWFASKNQSPRVKLQVNYLGRSWFRIYFVNFPEFQMPKKKYLECTESTLALSSSYLCILLCALGASVSMSDDYHDYQDVTILCVLLESQDRPIWPLVTRIIWPPEPAVREKLIISAMYFVAFFFWSSQLPRRFSECQPWNAWPDARLSPRIPGGNDMTCTSCYTAEECQPTSLVARRWNYFFKPPEPATRTKSNPQSSFSWQIWSSLLF